MIMQVFHRVDDVRDLCEKRCDQLRRLAVPVHRPVQRVQPLALDQNESLNLIGTTTTNLLHYPSNDLESTLSSSSSSSSSHQPPTSSNDLDSMLAHQAKMDKKQRSLPGSHLNDLERCCFRHVVTELLMTEQVYVDELRTVIEVSVHAFDSL